jgi:hypothetical protein
MDIQKQAASSRLLATWSKIATPSQYQANGMIIRYSLSSLAYHHLKITHRDSCGYFERRRHHTSELS